MSARRAELYRQIQLLAAGHAATDVLPALADCLATLSGFAAGDPEKGEQLLESLLPGMKAALRRHWPAIAQAIAAAQAIQRGDADAARLLAAYLRSGGPADAH